VNVLPAEIMDLLFLPIAFVSEIIGTIAGFGSSTIALPLSLFIFDFHTALALVAFLHIFGNISNSSDICCERTRAY